MKYLILLIPIIIFIVIWIYSELVIYHSGKDVYEWVKKLDKWLHKDNYKKDNLK